MKKCPYCAEDIQTDALKCKYCGEWLTKNRSNVESDSRYSRLASAAQNALPINIDNILLNKEYFMNSSKRYLYNDVIGLTYFYSIISDTVGLQRSSAISLSAHTKDGGGFSVSDFGRYVKKAEAIIRAYEVLRVLTFQSRYTYYISQLRNNGFIDYAISKGIGTLQFLKARVKNIGGSIEELSKAVDALTNYDHIFIYEDGTVAKDGKKVDLRTARDKNGILLGNSKAKFLNLWEAFGSTPLTRNPYQIALSEGGLGLLSNKIVFEATRDFDIIAQILTDLSTSKRY